MRRLGVEDDRVRHDQGAVAGGGRAPAEVDVVAEDRQLGVEAAELLEHRAAHQHAGGVDREHLADLVVLALVVLAALQPGLAATGAGDGDAELEQPAQRGPLAQLRAEDVGVGVGGGGREQRRERARVGVGVVVQDPDPLAGGALQAQPLETELDRGRERRGRRAPGARRRRPALEEVGAVVLAAGVDGDDRVDRGALGAEAVDDGGEPARAVMTDEQSRHRGNHARTLTAEGWRPDSAAPSR